MLIKIKFKGGWDNTELTNDLRFQIRGVSFTLTRPTQSKDTTTPNALSHEPTSNLRFYVKIASLSLC